MGDGDAIRGQWERARSMMESRGIDALLVTEKYNYWLLTGHRSEQFDGRQRPMILILPLRAEPRMIVYGRDEPQVRATVPVTNIKTYVDVPFPLELIPTALRELGLPRANVGCEIGEFQRLGISYNDFLSVQRALPSMTIVDASPIFNHIRMVKAPWEVERMRTACGLATAAWAKTLARLEPGMDVAQAQRIFEGEMLDTGGRIGHMEFGLEGHAFRHTYRRGDWLWCDFGVTYEGYRSDLARMAVFGPPTDQQKREFAMIWELTDNLIRRIGPGVRCSDLARRTSEDMVRLRLPPLDANKRVGHGFGVASDPPSISLADDTVLEPGMILTPEPRFVSPSGQRIHLEEDVVVTSSGGELLSHGAEVLGVIGADR
jgi:Xaa-Pro aminopeptidase